MKCSEPRWPEPPDIMAGIILKVAVILVPVLLPTPEPLQPTTPWQRFL